MSFFFKDDSVGLDSFSLSCSFTVFLIVRDDFSYYMPGIKVLVLLHFKLSGENHLSCPWWHWKHSLRDLIWHQMKCFP